MGGIEEAVFRLVIQRGRKGSRVTDFEKEREEGGCVWTFYWREKDRGYVPIFEGSEEGMKIENKYRILKTGRKGGSFVSIVDSRS